MIHDWSVRLGRYLEGELKLSQRDVTIVSYGLEIIIGGIIKIFFYISVPLSLGLFNQFWAAFFTAAVLRSAAGGAHCSTFCKCLLFTLLIFLGIAATSRALSMILLPAEEILLVSTVLAFLIFLIYAPLDVKEKPIKSANRRRWLKTISCVIAPACYVVITHLAPGQDIILACSLAICFSTFVVTKSGLKFIKFLDSVI